MVAPQLQNAYWFYPRKPNENRRSFKKLLIPYRVSWLRDRHCPNNFWLPWLSANLMMRISKKVKQKEGGKGLRWCGFALFLVRFCGNFNFNSRYCGFTTLSGLWFLQPLGHGIRWKKSACGDDTLKNGQHQVIMQARAKCFTVMAFSS